MVFPILVTGTIGVGWVFQDEGSTCKKAQKQNLSDRSTDTGAGAMGLMHSHQHSHIRTVGVAGCTFHSGHPKPSIAFKLLAFYDFL